MALKMLGFWVVFPFRVFFFKPGFSGFKRVQNKALTVPHFWGTRSCLVPLSKLRQPFLPRSFFVERNGVPFFVPFSVPFLDYLRWDLLVSLNNFHRSRSILAYDLLFSKKRVFEENLRNFHLILNWKERKRDETVPFCVPLILEVSVPASFLSDFRGTVPASFLKNRNAFRNAFLWTAFL